MNKTFFYLLLISISYSFIENVTAQDSTAITYKHSSSFAVGYSMPLGVYKSTSSTSAGYALGGFAAMADYNYVIYKGLGVNLNYGFIRNTLNTDAMSINNKSTIENQIGESITYAKADANNWFTSSLLIGPSYKLSLCKNNKLSLLVSLGAGASYVTTPATAYEAYIKGAIFETSSVRTHNFAFAYNATAGISYKFQEKTSLTFNTSYFNTEVYGNNLKTIYVGNNNYTVKQYSFQQKVTSVNFTIGLTTHF